MLKMLGAPITQVDSEPSMAEKLPSVAVACFTPAEIIAPDKSSSADATTTDTRNKRRDSPKDKRPRSNSFLPDVEIKPIGIDKAVPRVAVVSPDVTARCEDRMRKDNPYDRWAKWIWQSWVERHKPSY